MFRNFKNYKFTNRFIYTVGLATIFTYSYKSFNQIISTIKERFVFTPQSLKRQYGEGWVIITGGTSGLGYCYAKQFSELGYDICLVSRDENKLNNVSDELTKKYNVKTKVIVHDFATQNKQSIENLRTNLLELDNISIIINNVGILTDRDQKFEDVSIDNLLSMVNVNCTSILIMYKILFKKLKDQSNRSLFIDVSSLLGDVGYINNYIVYQATKSFVTKFSLKIGDQIKMENKIRKFPVYKIDILTIKPSHFVTSMNPNKTIISEKPEKIVRATLQNIVDKKFESHGTTKHELFAFIMKSMPKHLIEKYYAENFYLKTVKDTDSLNVDLSEFEEK